MDPTKGLILLSSTRRHPPIFDVEFERPSETEREADKEPVVALLNLPSNSKQREQPCRVEWRVKAALANKGLVAPTSRHVIYCIAT